MLIAYTIILSFYISWVSLIGLAIIILINIISVFIGSFIAKYSKSKFLLSDQRNKQVNNVIVGIK